MTAAAGSTAQASQSPAALRPSMLEKALISALSVVPKKELSKTTGWLAGIRSRLAVRGFAERFELDMSEAERPLSEYASVLELFTRRLKPGARPLDPDPARMLSPADGRLLVNQRIEDGSLVQAKGHSYRLEALTGDDAALSTFRGGSMCTVYLSPRDYHRVHAPTAGEILGFSHLPGELWPVNAAAVQQVPGLFSTNERLITHLQTERFGRVDVVMVGATNVGRIRVSYDVVHTNDGRRSPFVHRYTKPLPCERGQELGVFELGSTVILLSERPLAFEDLDVGQPVRMGASLARVAP